MKTGSGKDKLPKESIVLDLGQDELPVHPSIGALPGVVSSGGGSIRDSARGLGIGPSVAIGDRKKLAID